MERCRSGFVFGIFMLIVLAASAPQADVIPAQHCAAAKLRAAGKAVDAVLKCQAKRALVGYGDSFCFGNADLELIHAFEAADKQGPCAGDLPAIEAILKGAIDASVFALLPETCTLQATMDGGVTCVQNPDLPACAPEFGCPLEHADAARGRTLYYCPCF